MKKVIGGKRYDTDTAELLAEYSNMENRRDFAQWDEKLYRTKKTKKFFLFGEGGPQTKYAKTIGTNEWSGSEDIFLLTEAEAKKWVEEYANEEYENIFGEVEEG